MSNNGYDYLDSSGWFSGSEADKDFSGEPWDMDSGSEADRDFSEELEDESSGWDFSGGH